MCRRILLHVSKHIIYWYSSPCCLIITIVNRLIFLKKLLCNCQLCQCWAICKKKFKLFVVCILLSLFLIFSILFHGEFQHFHVITTLLHQWPSCWDFDVGVCCVIPAEETSAVGILPTSISLKSRRVLLACPLWQNMWENPLHSDVLQVKSCWGSYMNTSQSVCLCVRPISHCLNAREKNTYTSWTWTGKQEMLISNHCNHVLLL